MRARSEKAVRVRRRGRKYPAAWRGVRKSRARDGEVGNACARENEAEKFGYTVPLAESGPPKPSMPPKSTPTSTLSLPNVLRTFLSGSNFYTQFREMERNLTRDQSALLKKTGKQLDLLTLTTIVQNQEIDTHKAETKSKRITGKVTVKKDAQEAFYSIKDIEETRVAAEQQAQRRIEKMQKKEQKKTEKKGRRDKTVQQPVEDLID
ncbi:hypothetical protein F4861DRAFT_542897 [Xylaria intraflava]|nr:hypothetical protein F4861DRAFT_542897 [Xylaria intraflava]